MPEQDRHPGEWEEWEPHPRRPHPGPQQWPGWDRYATVAHPDQPTWPRQDAPPPAEPWPAPEPPSAAPPAPEWAWPAQPAPPTRPMPSVEPRPEPREVRRSEHPNPGLIAIDFGTSNSTVTLYDIGARQWLPLSPRQRRRLAAELTALLEGDLGGACPPAWAEEWRRTAERIAERVLRSVGRGTADAPPLSRLAVLLHADPDTTVVNRLMLELERARAVCSPPLRRLVTARIDRCHEAAFREPPLDMLRLFPVELNLSNGATVLPSIAYVTGRGSPPRVSMLPPAEGDEELDGEARRGYRGLKQRLARREARVGPAGEYRVDDLVCGVLHDLLRRTDDYVERYRNHHSFAPGRINQVLVTYPTMAPPRVRRTLEAMVAEAGVGRVITRFDEAIGAAMFFLMREFGGVFDPSVEAFAARSRPVSPPSDNAYRAEWRQHVLIIDIGGGTTDIALLRLELADLTPQQEAESDPHYGRYYRLTPRLLGTTGEAQRGGEYLTLLVFHWVKALLAERVIQVALSLPEPGDQGPGTAEPAAAGYAREIRKRITVFNDRFKDADGRYVPGSLLAASLSGEPGARESARDDIDLVVPTRVRHREGAEKERAGQAFDLLWDLAEQAKIALGDRRADYTLPAEDVAQILSVLGAPAAAAQDPLELRYEDFTHLVRPVLTELMRLAADLVRNQLTDKERAVPLDRVIFTGRGSRLGLVREELVAAFAERPDDRKPIDWDPSAVWIEDDYAKHATSIGACWAETIRQEVHPAPAAVADKLREGAVYLQIDVENLFFFLRGTFTVGGRVESGSLASRTLFASGTPLTRLGDDDRLVARNGEWIALTESFQVQRRKSDTETVHWAFFRVHDYAQEHPEPGFTLDEEIWRTEVYAQVEVDADLDMHILLCRGRRPHYAVGPAQRTVRPAGAAGYGGYEGYGGAAAEPGAAPPRLTALDAPIVVNPGVPGSIADPGTGALFPAGSAEELFDELFVIDGGPDAEPFRGTMRRLPPPAPYGWRFYRRRSTSAPGAGGPDPTDPEATGVYRRPAAGLGDGGDELIAEIPLAEVAGKGEPGGADEYWATLDEYGGLRVHRGMPPFRAASGLREVQEVPGTVLRVPMLSSDQDYREDYDPFSGVH